MMLKDTLLEFGKSMGINELALSQENIVHLSIENIGELYIEESQSDALVMLMKELTHPSLREYKKALELCHYRQKNKFITSTALFEENKLVFMIRLPHEEITKSNLDKAIEFLHKLHTTIQEIDKS